MGSKARSLLDSIPKNYEEGKKCVNEHTCVCQAMVVADHVMADRLIQFCELRASQLVTIKNVTEIIQVGNLTTYLPLS